ncbi:ATP-binding protein [Streptosporangium sp. H16]|uniref:ATP-binding protein n=1 Tax=Streptosporangium sp. H16 TaxID=3444184 RepID=UPI003F7AC35C
MSGREGRERPTGRHRRGALVSPAAPRRWDADSVARARQLDLLEPAWAVWYGPATRRFHAVALWSAPQPLIVYAGTVEELRDLMREAEHLRPAHETRPTASPPSRTRESEHTSSALRGATMPDIPDDPRTACWDVPHDPSAIAKIRALVDDTLTAWTLAYLADDVVLVAGELLANAVVHGDAPATLSLRAGADEFRLEVTDRGPGQPRHLRLDTDALHGRGLTIVEALAHESGVTPLPDHPGKTVWARWWLLPGTTSRPSS